MFGKEIKTFIISVRNRFSAVILSDACLSLAVSWSMEKAPPVLASCFVKGVFTLFHKRRTVNTIDVKDTYFGNSTFNSHTEATKLKGTPLSGLYPR